MNFFSQPSDLFYGSEWVKWRNKGPFFLTITDNGFLIIEKQWRSHWCCYIWSEPSSTKTDTRPGGYTLLPGDGFLNLKDTIYAEASIQNAFLAELFSDHHSMPLNYWPNFFGPPPLDRSRSCFQSLFNCSIFSSKFADSVFQFLLWILEFFV
jgi:hypothetical protein